VSRAVEDVLSRAVAQNPTERPHDAGVFWALLADAIVPSMTRDLGATMVDRRGEGASSPVAGQPSPFAGTMLMANAPGGAPHLVVPLPAAGRPPDAPPAQQVSRGTSPLNPPMRAPAPGSVPPAPGPESLDEARARGGQMKMTLPFGALSPLAASMIQGPSASDPRAGEARNAPTPQSGPPPPQSVAPPTTHRIVAPSPSRSNVILVIALVAALMIAIAGVTLYVIRVRGH
jgi:hypothetical protein